MKRKKLFLTIFLSFYLITSCKTERIYKELFELSENDFKEYPIWENCTFNGIVKMNNDSNVGINTFTPFKQKKLNELDSGYYLVKTKFIFADSSEYTGYIIPKSGKIDSLKIGKIEPTIFYKNQKLTFWKGILGINSIEINEFYEKAGKSKSEIFPIKFFTNSELTGTVMKGNIPGIGYCEDYNCESIKFEK